MVEPNTNRHAVQLGAPQSPRGKRIGSYIEREGSTVWRRRVKQKHILRILDAFTVNETILGQLRQRKVDLIRYELRDVGSYEISLDSFLRLCTILRRFAEGEDVYAVPRSEWTFKPAEGNGALKLFELDDQDKKDSRN